MAYDFAPDPYQSFQMGQQVGASKFAGLGEFAKQVTERAKALDLLHAKAQYDVQAKQASPSGQLQQGVLNSIQDLSTSGERVQPEADMLEQRAAQGEFGNDVDFQGLLSSQSPEAQRTDKARSFMDLIQEQGISGLSDSGITMRPFSSSMVDQGYFDQKTGQFVTTGSVPKYSQYKTKRLTPDEERELAEGRGAGYTQGRLETQGLGVEQTNAITANRSIVRSVDNLIGLFDSDPGLFERASVPGARLGDEQMKEVNLWLNNIQNYKALAQGGRTLTANELERTRSTLTSLIRGEPVSREALQEIRQVAGESLGLLEGTYSQGRSGQSSQMGYVRTGIDEETGQRVGELSDGTIEVIP